MDQTAAVTLRELLEVGAHFGHQRSRWNPAMRPYIFGLRGGVYVIDLQKTVVLLQDAINFVRDMAAQGKIVLFVGTKKQAQEIVVREAKRCEMFYVDERWLGGLLTNWATVKRSIDKLKELETLETDAKFAHLTKKERLSLAKTRTRLDKTLSGIKDMGRRPDVVFIVDVGREAIAVDESNKLGIPVIGIVDTNSDPSRIDFPVPANDDAIRSIELIASRLADAINEGRNIWRAQRPERTARPARGGRRPGRDEAATEAPAATTLDESEATVPVAPEASGAAGEPTEQA